MNPEIRLSADGERVLREATNFCYRANIAIVAAEHVLAGSLVVLREAGAVALPAREALDAALASVVGSGAEAVRGDVKFGSSARETMNATAAAVRAAGGTAITARLLALGALDSGEVSPAFFAALGLPRGALRQLVD